MARIVIVGGGISGLATACRLQRLLPHADITLLESASRVGGTIWTERRDGFQVELGPNGFLSTPTSTLDFCDEIGIADRLIPASDVARHRFLFINGKLEELPDGLWSFLRSPLLSWRGKLAVMTERFRPPKRNDAEETVYDFVARRTSPEVADLFADALVTGIHAGDPRLLSMEAAFPRVTSMERDYGSVTAGLSRAAKERRQKAKAQGKAGHSGSLTMSFRDGLRRLVETAADRLRRPPVLGVSVRRLQRSGDPASDGRKVWRVHADGKDVWSAEAVVLACPAYVQRDLMSDVSPRLAELVGGISYSPAVVVALGYLQSDVPTGLAGFGYIVPQRQGQDLLGVHWCSSIFPQRAPAGMVLLRAIAGGWNRPDVVSWSDARLLASLQRHLAEALGIQAPPRFHRIVRWPKAIPQYHLGHLDRLAAIERELTELPGLFLTGNAYRGVAMNDCTAQSLVIAQQVARFLGED